MKQDPGWLDASWPFVRDWLPGPPAVVTEIGCGPRGGFIPALRSAGHQATGIDPEAPHGPWYRQQTFESWVADRPADVVVASTSLHHVGDLADVLDRIRAALVPGGVVAVIEWARERVDEATARWCFSRLPPAEPGQAGEDGEHNWLRHRQADWHASGLAWDAYWQSWAQAEGLHAGQDIIDGLDARFDRELIEYGPYFFDDLGHVSEADEQAAIDRGQIQATRIRYAGRRR
ncbi:MAG TPA: methyltransferase domain-containing protein [Streptosporangiaceae bacterium]